jgi:NADH:ubiquinone oxidoreductase subunit C
MLEKIYIAKYFGNIIPRFLTAIFIQKTAVYMIGKSDLNIGRTFGLSFISRDLCLRYTSLVDLWCVDYLKYFSSVRFELDYRLRSFIHLNFDVIYSIHLYLDEPPVVPSVFSFFPSADWLEREILDLYGIFSVGNTNMRRILTDYGFSGYPFRKDFPICGYKEIRYDEELSGLVMEPVVMAQDFRLFSRFHTIWASGK